MELLTFDDPVFVVDLTPATMRRCAAELAAPATDATGPATPPVAPDEPLRAVALVFSLEAAPILLAIPPTRDTAALDAAARLLRVALLTGRSMGQLAFEHGDAELRRLYRERLLPPFIYEGIPPALRRALDDIGREG